MGHVKERKDRRGIANFKDKKRKKTTKPKERNKFKKRQKRYLLSVFFIESLFFC